MEWSGFWVRVILSSARPSGQAQVNHVMIAQYPGESLRDRVVIRRLRRELA